MSAIQSHACARDIGLAKCAASAAITAFDSMDPISIWFATCNRQMVPGVALSGKGGVMSKLLVQLVCSTHPCFKCGIGGGLLAFEDFPQLRFLDKLFFKSLDTPLATPVVAIFRGRTRDEVMPNSIDANSHA